MSTTDCSCFGHYPPAQTLSQRREGPASACAIIGPLRRGGLWALQKDSGYLSRYGSEYDRLVEAAIGTIRSPRYGFNRPAARSTAMIGSRGQRAVLGFDTTKLIAEVAGQQGMLLTG